MNTPIAKQQYAFSLGNLSYIGPAYEEVQTPVVKPRAGSFGRALHRIVLAVTGWRRRQVILREMQLMTDRELADVGLSRSDLSRVFDPAFAADHPRGRDYVAY